MPQHGTLALPSFFPHFLSGLDTVSPLFVQKNTNLKTVEVCRKDGVLRKKFKCNSGDFVGKDSRGEVSTCAQPTATLQYYFFTSPFPPIPIYEASFFGGSANPR